MKNDQDAARPQTGARRFFQVFFQSAWKLAGINLLFVLCSLPILTAPAAYGALMQLTRRIAQERPVDVWRDYFDSFRENFRQATLFGLPYAALMLALSYLTQAYIANIGISKWLWLPVAATPLFMILLAIAGFYVFLIMTSVELPLKAILNNAWRLTLGRLIKNLAVLALLAALLGVGILLLPLGIYYMLLIMVSAQAYCIVWFCYPDIRRSMIAAQPDAEAGPEERPTRQRNMP